MAAGGGGPAPTLGLYVRCAVTSAWVAGVWRYGSFGKNERSAARAVPEVEARPLDLLVVFEGRGGTWVRCRVTAAGFARPESFSSPTAARSASSLNCAVTRRRIEPLCAWSGAGGRADIAQFDGYEERGYQRPLDASQSVSARSSHVTPFIHEW